MQRGRERAIETAERKIDGERQRGKEAERSERHRGSREKERKREREKERKREREKERKRERENERKRQRDKERGSCPARSSVPFVPEPGRRRQAIFKELDVDNSKTLTRNELEAIADRLGAGLLAAGGRTPLSPLAVLLLDLIQRSPTRLSAALSARRDEQFTRACAPRHGPGDEAAGPGGDRPRELRRIPELVQVSTTRSEYNSNVK
jgi:hypothetical protein